MFAGTMRFASCSTGGAEIAGLDIGARGCKSEL